MTALADFHFLRPLWLLLLPLVIWLLLRGSAVRFQGNPWRRACDPELLAAMLPPAQQGQSLGRILLLIGAVLAVLSLAGPSWQRLPTPALQAQDARILVIDLSRSMDADDVPPSRLSEARRQAQRLIAGLPGSRFGLVAFAGAAYPVLPLAEDPRTVSHLLAALSTELMPVQGSNPAAAIDLAVELLQQAAALEGDILLFTDTESAPAAMEAAQRAAVRGYRLLVFGLGTTAGGPIPLAKGGLLQDKTGRPVVARLDEPGLITLAAAGRGRYVQVNGDLDVSSFAWPAERMRLSESVERFTTDLWRDEGRWLLLLLLPLAALGFRRGWLPTVTLVVLLSQPPTAYALDWQRWWRDANEEGQALLLAGRPAAAALAFRDEAWRGVAQYRAGSYDAAARSFSHDASPRGHYNRGNALAKAGRYAEAVRAYDEALAFDPQMEDARFNRALVAALTKPSAAPGEKHESSTAQQPAADAAGEGEGQGAKGQDGEGTSDKGEGSGDPSSSAADHSNSKPGQASQMAGNRQETSAQSEPSDQQAAQGKTQQSGVAQQPGEQESARLQEQAGRNSETDRSKAEEGSSDRTSERNANSGQETTRGTDIDFWMQHVERDPGGLLRRKFQRLQEQAETAPEESQSW